MENAALRGQVYNQIAILTSFRKRLFGRCFLHQDMIPDGLLYKPRATGELNVQQRFEKHKVKLLLYVSQATLS